MFRKKKNQELDLTQKEPCAGERRKFLAGEAVFFSPKPMPAYHLKSEDTVPSSEILEVNDAYMDIGVRCQGKAFQVQFGLVSINAVSFVALLILTHAGFFYGGPFLDAFLRAFNEIVFGISIVYLLLAGIVWFVIIKTSFEYARQRPIRFHRQRREICYYPDGRTTPVIAPWEQIVSWVALSRGTTGTNVMTTYTFGMAIPTPDGKDYWLLRQPVYSVGEAQRKWETMRSYMDEPQKNWPRSLPFIKEDRAMFDAERERIWAKFKKGPRKWLSFKFTDPADSYFTLFCYYFYHILSCWKIPYLVSEWTDSLNKKPLPENINEWSQPLPKNEWQQPSEALLTQRTAIKKHYEAGGNLTNFLQTKH
ncbi:hypothetical protein LRP49_18760 [Enterovibrio sp. ZSDZ35]|uniref:Uncharacterized protein n=1 Tax=Enterovibrio qingdaonensis TaxID=2899818 RepID=A0ABT5QRA2_9GAMM|nr:DUF6708 domain-containing protein [Enterovibrio sp. ZSDZ35]MDD1783213.1 hypothetical protein [Enterovibrio sp. ZSDZ35]